MYKLLFLYKLMSHNFLFTILNKNWPIGIRKYSHSLPRASHSPSRFLVYLAFSRTEHTNHIKDVRFFEDAAPHYVRPNARGCVAFLRLGEVQVDNRKIPF